MNNVFMYPYLFYFYICCKLEIESLDLESAENSLERNNYYSFKIKNN